MKNGERRPAFSHATAASTTSPPRPLGLEPRALVGIAPDAIVVGIEPVRQPESTIEHVGADKGTRLIARILQPRASGGAAG